jgi:hypothetical protein
MPRLGRADDAGGRGVARPVLALWKEAARKRETRLALARVSIAFFAWYYLRARGKPIAVPRCHVSWYRDIGTGEGYRRRPFRQKKLLLLAPRSHGKSLVAAFVVALHRVCFNRNVRILLISKKADGAIKRLRRIRKQLEANPRIVADFGGPDGFRDPAAPWTDHQVQVRRDDQSLADPTLEAAGAGGAITGGRFDLIIADDPEDDETVLTAHVRARTRAWFKATVQELLEPWGECLLIGTRKHNDDLYGNIERSDPTFRVVKHQAIIRWPDEWEWITDEHGTVVGARITAGKAEVLWPEVWHIEALLVKRHSMGSTLFARENQNEVVSDDTASFRLPWLMAAKERGATQRLWSSSADVPEGWVVIIAVDPAFVDDARKAAEGDTDYTVAWVIGVNLTTWHRRIVNGFRVRGLGPNELQQRIRTLAQPFTVPVDGIHPAGALRYIAVEANSLGKLYEIGLRTATDLPLVPHSTTQKKADPYEGVPAMASLFENGQIDFCAEGADQNHLILLDAAVDELHGLGSERHDDTVMALWIGECIIRKMKAAANRREQPRRNIKRGTIGRRTEPPPAPADDSTAARDRAGPQR